MHRYQPVNNLARSPIERLNTPITSTQEPGLPPNTFSLKELSKARLNSPTAEEARLASLKVLAMTLLSQVESLEKQMDAGTVPELNLQNEVHRFEEEIIRSALRKTGGRQRRAARLLGVKVTTLNTKIKRYNINSTKPE
jgi:DNA-binding NtrC family response regulator